MFLELIPRHEFLHILNPTYIYTLIFGHKLFYILNPLKLNQLHLILD